MKLIFDPIYRAAGWFSSLLSPAGWFDQELTDDSSTVVVGPLVLHVVIVPVIVANVAQDGYSFSKKRRRKRTVLPAFVQLDTLRIFARIGLARATAGASALVSSFRARLRIRAPRVSAASVVLVSPVRCRCSVLPVSVSAGAFVLIRPTRQQVVLQSVSARGGTFYTVAEMNALALLIEEAA